MIGWLWLGCRPPDPEPATHTTPPAPTPPDTTLEPPPGPLEVTGELTSDTTWSPSDASWILVTGELVVPAGITLEIGPATDVRFASRASITVYGELVAVGTESERIALRSDPLAPWEPDLHPSLPEGPPKWSGVQFVDTGSERNRIAYADVTGAQTMDGSIGVFDAAATLDHLTISGTRLRSVYAERATVTVADSVFPTMFTEDDDPDVLGLDNEAEYVKAIGGIPAGGHFRIERNLFGVPKGHNDVIDVTGNTWPAEVVEIRGNVFEGGGDEGIDGGGDLLLDGNVFRAIVKDGDNHGSGDSNCLSTGDSSTTVVVATRNLYLGVDHAANLKRESFGYFEHNTIVGISPSRPSAPGDNPPRTLLSSAIRLVIPDPLDPLGAPPRDVAGVGAWLDGNVLAGIPEVVFGNPDENGSHGAWTSWLAVQNTLVEDAAVFANADGLHGRAFQYTVGAPVFDAEHHLAAGSPGV
ncbi:MAG: hypothetical protein ABMA64_06700, partial [Myxococcota bacterium]